jgi:hypothetical protein
MTEFINFIVNTPELKITVTIITLCVIYLLIHSLTNRKK